MKKVFFAAMAMVVVLFASCEKVEPTAITPDQLNSTIKLIGTIECETSSLKTAKEMVKDTVVLKKQPVQVMVKYDAKSAYETYSVTTGNDGTYSIDLKVAAGNALAEVLIQSECYKESKAVAKNRNGDLEEVNAYFFGQNNRSNVRGGQTITLNLLLKANAYVGPGMSDPE